jgi:hypothetical protein
MKIFLMEIALQIVFLILGIMILILVQVSLLFMLHDHTATIMSVYLQTFLMIYNLNWMAWQDLGNKKIGRCT